MTCRQTSTIAAQQRRPVAATKPEESLPTSQLSTQDRFYDRLQTVDYGVLLPALAKLPLPIGQALAAGRGLANAMFDLDWRSLALRHRYVRKATYRAMGQLMPQRPAVFHAANTVRRFMHYSREEWEACLFSDQDRMRTILDHCTVEGIGPLLDIQKNGRGLVLLGMHFDSCSLGSALLGHRGLRVNIVTSAVVEDARVHPAVRAFYARKYRGMEHYLNGGKMVHFEQNLRHCHRALRRGEAVIFPADLPPSTPSAYQVTVPFLGGPKKMAAGALRMAEQSGSAMAAFICMHKSSGCYKLTCSAPRELAIDDPALTLVPLYAFFEDYLRNAPDRWWAAELLSSYQDG